MRPELPKLLAFAFLLVALPCALAADPERALERELGKYRNQVLLGYELELDLQKTAGLVRHLDLDFFEEKLRALPPSKFKAILPDALLQDYLLNDRALEALSPELRQELTKGLSLTQNLIARPDGAQGAEKGVQRIDLIRSPENAPRPTQPARTEGGLILPQKDGGGGLRKAPSPANALDPTLHPDRFHEQGGLLRSRASDWQILQDRWNRLPWRRKIQEIKLTHLPPKNVAGAISRLAETIPEEKLQIKLPIDSFIRPREDAPDAVKRLSFELDNIEGGRGVLEVKLRAPQADPVVFLRDIEELGRITGAKSQVEMPTLHKRGDIAFHMHVSTPLVGSHGEHRRTLEAYKKLLLLRLLRSGPHYDSILGAGASHMNLHSPGLPKKGTVFLHTRTEEEALAKGMIRTELREHSTSPAKELAEYLRLATADPKQAQAHLDSEISGILKTEPTLVERIQARKPDVLWDFFEYLPAWQREIEGKIVSELRHSNESPTLRSLLTAWGGPTPARVELAERLAAADKSGKTSLAMLENLSQMKTGFAGDTDARLTALFLSDPGSFTRSKEGFLVLSRLRRFSELGTLYVEHLLRSPGERQLAMLGEYLEHLRFLNTPNPSRDFALSIVGELLEKKTLPPEAQAAARAIVVRFQPNTGQGCVNRALRSIFRGF